MPYLQSNIPYFKAWVRREYTHNMSAYHGEFLHCMVVAVTTMPNRTLSFQVIFTGFESDDDESTPNVHGGAMWARMPITALVADELLEEWPRKNGDTPSTTLGLFFTSSLNSKYGKS